MGFADKLKEKHGDPDNYTADEGAFGGPDLDLPLKPGAYVFEIQPDHTDEVSTSSGGEMLKLDLKVMGPKYEGRRLFENFVYDCPKNRDFEEEESDRIMLVADVCGIDGYPEIHDWTGKQFIGVTGLETNEYKGDLEYQATLWDVRPLSDGPAEGPWPDDDQPDIWEEAVAFAKGDYDPRRPDDLSGGQSNTQHVDDSDIPF